MAEIATAAAEVFLMYCGEFDADQMDSFDAVAFGCPSMGSEQPEDREFELVFTVCKGKHAGKKIALFGSYGQGVGNQAVEGLCVGRADLCINLKFEELWIFCTI